MPLHNEKELQECGDDAWYEALPDDVKVLPDLDESKNAISGFSPCADHCVGCCFHFNHSQKEAVIHLGYFSFIWSAVSLFIGLALGKFVL